MDGEGAKYRTFCSMPWLSVAQDADTATEGHAIAAALVRYQLNEGALTVLGDLLRDRGNTASAKLYWMGAYHLGDRDAAR
jgi:hypothetical protein